MTPRHAMQIKRQTMAAIAMLISACATAAQPRTDYPHHPVRFIIAQTTGGNADFVGRLLADALAKRLGQPFVVDNRAGASGIIAGEITAKAAPDGYTLLLATTGFAVNPGLYKSMPYHPLRDFEPITQATVYPNVIIVHPSHPANNLQDLLAMARREPGKLAFAHDGTGTGSHLTMELLLFKAGVKMQPVAYKGTAPIMADVMGQQVPVAITGIIGAITGYKAGKVKVLGVTALTRSAAAPELPTVAEQGFPGFSGEPWSGFFAPKGTPKPIVDKLATDMIAAMRLPDVAKKMADLGTPLVGSRPEQFREYVAREIEKWAEAVKVSGATAE